MEKTELHGSHLDSTKYYITTCLAEQNSNYFLKDNGGLEDSVYIDYYLNDKKYIDEIDISFRNEKGTGFIISDISSQNKYSLEYKNCTGIVAIGKDRNTGKNISFLSHQDPWYFLSNDKSKVNLDKGSSRQEVFIELLKKHLIKLKNMSEKGTVDIIILGGNNNSMNKSWYNVGYLYEEYEESIKLLDKVIFEIFNFHSIISGGPNIRGKKGVFVDTQNRRVYYYKNNNNIELNKNFVGNQINDIFCKNTLFCFKKTFKKQIDILKKQILMKLKK